METTINQLVYKAPRRVSPTVCSSHIHQQGSLILGCAMSKDETAYVDAQAVPVVLYGRRCTSDVEATCA